ncbi:hypothetical protein EG68_05177 [Paragonimus skrjabini miyazakii]|uniref:Apple domain-containing protein n=1 Tax=Paragonimus skrjabini miyazakii TaxID=59628 RepID=A0A8S9YVX2_9TREM|nr:hypothetical protein EG68_05177 [Paragonimus skrjabini miyazakii]
MCMILVKERVNYCTAHRKCAQLEKLDGRQTFLVGSNAHEIPETILDHNVIWTSFNKLLGTDVGEWSTWHDADTRFGIVIRNWAPDYPLLGEYRLVKSSAEGFINVDQTDEDAMFVCEMRSLRSARLSPLGTMRWIKAPETSNERPFFSTTEHSGCHELFRNKTLSSCGYACAQNSNCRSFYHEPSEGHCILVLFVDTLLPKSMNNDENWSYYVQENFEQPK